MSTCICQKCKGNGFKWVNIPLRITEACVDCCSSGETGENNKFNSNRKEEHEYQGIDRTRKTA